MGKINHTKLKHRVAGYNAARDPIHPRKDRSKPNPFEGIPWEKKNTKDTLGDCTKCDGLFDLKRGDKGKRYLRCNKCGMTYPLPNHKYGILVRVGTCRRHNAPLVRVVTNTWWLCPLFKSCKNGKCRIKRRQHRRNW